MPFSASITMSSVGAPKILAGDLHFGSDAQIQSERRRVAGNDGG